MATFDEPSQLDLPVIWRGLPWGPTTVTVTQGGTPVNLTGYTIAAKTPKFSLNPVVTSPIGGVISLSMTAAATALLPIGDEVYDVTGVTASGGFTKPMFSGHVPVKHPVSK